MLGVTVVSTNLIIAHLYGAIADAVLIIGRNLAGEVAGPDTHHILVAADNPAVVAAVGPAVDALDYLAAALHLVGKY